MTLKIQESPEPISLFISGGIQEKSKIDICEGEIVSFIGTGNEVYERFEWYKNGELIPGANQNTFRTGEEGVYEVLGYNRKNCPAVSNKIAVSFPDYPSLNFNTIVVGCSLGKAVDITAEIPGYDLTLYDYQLSGLGVTLLNDALKSVAKSGLYELRVKLKDLDCYSVPVIVEVFIQEEELTVDFDFGVQGTGVKDDLGGGIFPDDVIQFTDLSDSRGVKWEWNFGDGTNSQQQNPAHTFGKKGEFVVELMISDSYGCQETVTKTVLITRSYRLMIPTGFTPTETQNRTFLPKQKGLIRIELLIFNTWGDLIFRTEDIETEGWDGTLNGKLLDAGLYVYRVNGVTTDGEEVRESGKFRLIR